MHRWLLARPAFDRSCKKPYERYNGHIDYSIRPPQRGKGYVTRMLAMLAEEAQRLHLPELSLAFRETIRRRCG